MELLNIFWIKKSKKKKQDKLKRKKAKKALIFIEDGSFTYDNRVRREAQTLIEAGWFLSVISPRSDVDPWVRKINKRLYLYFYPKPTFKSLYGHILETLFSLFLGTLLSIWVLIRHGFSVFHACNPMDIVWMIALPYKILGKKFIYDQHDLVPELILTRDVKKRKSLLLKMILFFEKQSYRLADCIIVVNESFRKIAISRGQKPEEKIFVVRNGPDLNNFKIVPPKKIRKPVGELWVGYLGNMNPQDGVENLLKAAHLILKKHLRKDMKFILIGGGSSFPEILKESKKLKINNAVIFTGKLYGEELLEILSACDICVQPDPLNPLNDISTMNKALEYMALEKPVVAFDLKETRVSCGDAALYVTPNDVEELAEKILILADNPRLREYLGKKGRERVERGFSWAYSAPNLILAYERALNPREGWRERGLES